MVTYKVHLSFIDCVNVFIEPPGHERASGKQNNQIIHRGVDSQCSIYSIYVLITYYVSHALYVLLL